MVIRRVENPRRCSSWTLFGSLLLLSVFWGPSPTTAQVSGSCAENANDNGIKVGAPKLYDPRELQFMLQETKSRLATLNAIQGDKLIAAQGSLQGGEATESSFGLSATELQRPATGAGPTGDPAGTPATAPTQAANIAYTASYSLSARDLLAEQMQVSYQINNLQLLLDQSITDRVDLGEALALQQLKQGCKKLVAQRRTLQKGRGLSGTDLQEDLKDYAKSFLCNTSTTALRRQPVLLGFQVNVDPDARNRRSVAEVRVTLTLESSVPEISDLDTRSLGTLEAAFRSAWVWSQTPRVTRLYPAKDTYNTASLVKKARDFGLGTIAGVVSLGIAGNKKSESFYLVKDIDTLAFEKPNRGPETVEFGWQFRPVLGHEVVEPGQRQVFALLSLPDFGADHFKLLDINIRTHWRRIEGFGNRAKRSLSKDRFAGERSCTLQSFPVPSETRLHETLAPKIETVRVHDAGGGKLLVGVEGENFFPGTRVLLGNKTLGTDDGLRIIGDTRLNLLAPTASLAKGEEVRLLSRYGKIKTVLASEVANTLSTAGARAKLALIDNETVRLELSDLCLLYENAPVLLEFGGSVFGPLIKTGSTGPDCGVLLTGGLGLPRGRTVSPTSYEVVIPRALLMKDDRLMVTVPFHTNGSRPTSSARATIPVERGDVFYASSFSELGPAPSPVKSKLYAISGVNLKPCSFKVILRGNSISPREACIKASDSLRQLTFVILESDLKGVAKLWLQQGSETQLLSKKPPPPPGPSDLKPGSAQVFKDDSVEIEIQGTHLGAIEEVRFEDKKLETWTEKGKFYVAITQAITAKIGTRQLTIIGKDKSVHKVTFAVVARPAAGGG